MKSSSMIVRISNKNYSFDLTSVLCPGYTKFVLMLSMLQAYNAAQDHIEQFTTVQHA
jgi:hypothetical protein